MQCECVHINSEGLQKGTVREIGRIVIVMGDNIEIETELPVYYTKRVVCL